MRAFFLTAVSFVAFSLLTGCATGLSAEVGSPPVVLPHASDTLRVRILFTKSPVRLDSTGSYQFQMRNGGKIYTASSVTSVRPMRGGMMFGRQKLKGDVVAMPAGDKDILKLNGRRYRGVFVFHPLAGGRYDVVEYVSMDDYVYGVLPREVEPSWPLESLKAQAIVSRTFALSNKLTDAKERFDVTDGVMDQVYGGMHVEDPASNKAVDETHGEILTDATGKPIQAFFHSSCGGHTELPEHVWKSSNAGDVFGCVSDAFCDGDPHYKWQLSISYRTIRTRLRKVGVRIGDIKKVTVVQKSESGRAEIFGLQTSNGLIPVPGNKFRLALGPENLRSTLIINMKAGKSNVWFEGRGWGHGVGLCQWGARGRALAGQTYKQILETYYPKAVLSKV